MSAPSPPPQDARIEHILLQTVPWDARKKGGNLLQDCLRDLWEKAVSIGFKYGEENIARAREEGFNEGKEAGFKEGVESGRETLVSRSGAQLVDLDAQGDSEEEVFIDAEEDEEVFIAAEDPSHSTGTQVVDIEKRLEQERVWGFDVGWKLCGELQKSHASQASLVPSPPSPRSLSVAATQTDTVAVHAATNAPLDWAEDAATLPIIPSHSAPSPSTLRDLSALRTGSPQPFASLQRRRRRSPRPPTSSAQDYSQHLSIRRPPRKSIHSAANRRTLPSYLHPPPSIHFPAPTTFPPSDKSAAKFPLDWDQDPRLRDLGQALAALGWVRL